MANNKSKCYVVDESDTILRMLERSSLTPDMRWRNTGVYLFNDKGEVLLAQRHETKKEHPGLWGPSASGTLEEGETYIENAYKELKEELGIDIKNLDYCGNFVINHGSAKRVTGMSKGTWNGSIEEITLEENEVSAVKWVPLEDLLLDIQKRPENYVPALNYTLSAIGIITKNPVKFKPVVNDSKKTLCYIS